MKRQISGGAGANQERLFSSIFPARLSKGDRKKMEIIEAAIVLFQENGIDQTSYDQIAAHLKTTRSHITYHFKERHDLVFSVIRYMMTLGHEFTFENMRKATTPEEQIVRYVDSYYDFFQIYPQFIPVMLYFYYFAGYPGPIRDLQSQVRREAFDRIHELVVQVLAGARKKKPVDLEDLVFSIQGLILGGMIFNISTSEPISESKTRATKKKVLKGIGQMLGVALNG